MSKSFVQGMREFYGFREGQGLSDFAKEIKALTHDDKMELASGLRAIGQDCDDPAPQA